MKTSSSPAKDFRNNFPRTDEGIASRSTVQRVQLFHKTVPDVIQDTLALAGTTKENVDYCILHRSNQFIVKHLAQAGRAQENPVDPGGFSAIPRPFGAVDRDRPGLSGRPTVRSTPAARRLRRSDCLCRTTLVGSPRMHARPI